MNVTLLFTAGHYVAAADAYLRGHRAARRGRPRPGVSSVASVFVSRWDAAVAGRLPEALEATARARHERRDLRGLPRLLASDRWQRLANEGARPQRLLWASTGTKDARMPDILYVDRAGRAATPSTPCRRGRSWRSPTTAPSRACCRRTAAMPTQVLAAVRAAGVDVDALGRRLQDDGAAAFVASWEQLMRCIEDKARDGGGGPMSAPDRLQSAALRDRAAWRALEAHRATPGRHAPA